MPEGRFSVLLPGKARSESRTLILSSAKVVMTMHAVSLERGTLGVAYTDFPPAALAAERTREQVNAARDTLLRNISGSVKSEEDVAVDGISGRQVHAEGSAGADYMILKARFVVVGSRLYQIAYVGAKDGLAMADVDMFLTSFKLLK